MPKPFCVVVSFRPADAPPRISRLAASSVPHNSLQWHAATIPTPNPRHHRRRRASRPKRPAASPQPSAASAAASRALAAGWAGAGSWWPGGFRAIVADVIHFTMCDELYLRWPGALERRTRDFRGGDSPSDSYLGNRSGAALDH